MKFVIVFIISTLIGVGGVFAYHHFTMHPNEPITNIVNTISQPEFKIENAPVGSVRGNILQMNGGIQWTSRTATEASELKTAIVLQQGESIQTEKNSNINIEFPNETLISVNPETQIDFIQTLPDNFVASIASGSANFKKTAVAPVSVRAMHLLTNLNDGEMYVEIDSDNSLVNINILSGSITVAYNDNNLESHVFNFVSGQKITFNDVTRSFE
ncbi:hypothetical protein BH10PAT1_BH10PAT1_6580 [soil metagenome]